MATAEEAAAAAGAGGGTVRNKEMRLCAVCGDITERRHLNYGGEACFSCRAFFRRYAERHGKLNCNKNDNKCEINETTRNDCMSCRLNQCIEKGMKKVLRI